MANIVQSKKANLPLFEKFPNNGRFAFYGLDSCLPVHFALWAGAVVCPDYAIDLPQAGAGQVACNSLFDRCHSVAVFHSLLHGEPRKDSVQHARYIGVAAANAIHHFDVPVRLLGIEDAAFCVV